MKILIISYVFPPFGGAGVQRIAKLAKFFISKKHHISVLTHNSGTTIDTDLFSDELNNVNILRISFHDDIENQKISPELESFISQQYPDVILSSSPTITAHFIAKKISEVYKVSWVADFRDIESEYISFFKYFSWRTAQEIELDILNSCDHIIVISEFHKKYLQKKYTIPGNKISIIMNGYDPDDFGSDIIKKRYKPTLAELTLVHVGTFYGKRSPLPLILNTIITRKKLDLNLKLKFVGRMSKSSKLFTKLFQKFIPIEIIAAVSHDEAIKIMCEADVLILVPGKFGVGVITGKIFEYIATGRPIINLFSYKKGPLLKEILNNIDGVYNIYEFNVNMFVDTISILTSTDYSFDYDRTEFLINFSRNNQYKLLENIIESIKKLGNVKMTSDELV